MKKAPQVNPEYAGSRFDDFLREEGIFEEVNAHAAKEVVAWQIAQGMKIQGINKAALVTDATCNKEALHAKNSG